MSAFRACSRTTCQTAFSVRPSPQALPFLFPRRNSLAVGQAGSLRPLIKHSLDPGRHGTVLVWPALPMKSTIAQWLLSLSEMAQIQVHRFVPPQAAGEQEAKTARSRLPFNCPTQADARAAGTVLR